MGKSLKGVELGVGISQRSDGRYVGRYSDNRGNRVQKVFSNLSKCRKWVADSRFSARHNNLDLSHNLVMDAWFEYWIGIKKRTVKSGTWQSYEQRYMSNIKPVIGNTLIREVSPVQCQLIMNRMSDEGYKNSTITLTKVVLRNMLEMAYQNDMIVKNPCNKGVKSAVGKKSEKRHALTSEQQALFCEAITGEPYEYPCKFILQTGLRAGEMIGLRWSDVDFDKRCIHIERTMLYRISLGGWVEGSPKTESGRRVVPLTKEAIKILRLQKLKNSSQTITNIEWQDQIFLGKKGVPTKNTAYDEWLCLLCERVGLPKISLHILRHTFATRCIEGGMRPKILQEILGHSNISTTMDIYVHLSDEEKRKEVDMIEGILSIV